MSEAMSRLLSAVGMSPTSTLLTVHWLSVDSEHLKEKQLIKMVISFGTGTCTVGWVDIGIGTKGKWEFVVSLEKVWEIAI
jgi:hypothetical protein